MMTIDFDFQEWIIGVIFLDKFYSTYECVYILLGFKIYYFKTTLVPWLIRH